MTMDLVVSPTMNMLFTILEVASFKNILPTYINRGSFII